MLVLQSPPASIREAAIPAIRFERTITVSYRIPACAPKVRLRPTEPIAFDGSRANVYRLNETAWHILRAVDGAKDERAIALACVQGNERHAEVFLPKCRAFLERCVAEGLLRWVAS